MSTFTVGQSSYNRSQMVRGQSFNPNVPGNGSGSPGSATQVFLDQIILSYPNGNTSIRAGNAYVYSVQLDDVAKIGEPENLVAQSNSTEDETGYFGTGTYTRTYNFPNSSALSPSATYYVYFDDDQQLRLRNGTPYSGGTAFDDVVEPITGDSFQFMIAMHT